MAAKGRLQTRVEFFVENYLHRISVRGSFWRQTACGVQWSERGDGDEREHDMGKVPHFAFDIQLRAPQRHYHQCDQRVNRYGSEASAPGAWIELSSASNSGWTA